ncbi:MAG: hypothetical protein IJ362_09225 [Oscillospiraceae bacterium]|nr:hypothetical protein [Oscillospiraceae bacterium]
MKKVIALALSVVMALSLVACGGEEAKAPAKFKVGMGHNISAKMTDATADKAGSAQVDTTMLVAAFDAEGKVVSVSIDVAQQKLGVNADGTTADAAKADIRTKVEKEGDYGMVGASGIGKEYFEQINALEDWMVGKTVEEIVGMPVMDRGDGSHTHVPTSEDLTSSVTITVKSYLDALQEAWDTAVEVEGVAKVGLGQNISVKGTAATTDKNGSVQVDTNMVGTALDAEGKIVWAKIDVAQQKIGFDAAGVKAGDVDVRTKVEKEGDYGMVGASGIGKEYFEQVKALGEWMVGKTVAEVAAMETFDRGDGSHTAVPAVEDLTSSVTITVGAYLDALVEAEANAK